MKSILSFILFLSIYSCSLNNEEVKSVIASKPVFTSGIEGPASNKNGMIYIVNFQREGTIGVFNPETGEADLQSNLPEGGIGNGIRFLNDSIYYVADYKQHNILKGNIYQPKKFEIYAHSELMNQPNDIAISSSGLLFASDPNWTESNGKLWRIAQDTAILLEENMGTTNGIEVDPTEKTLYVNESVQRKVWKYDLNAKGEISNKQLFYEFADHGLDGMRCDVKGNLYIARYDAGTVAVLNPQGILIREITLNGKKPTNLTFGGADGKTVFVTMQDKKWVEKFSVEHPGRSYSLRN